MRTNHPEDIGTEDTSREDQEEPYPSEGTNPAKKLRETSTKM
jgi:hypothetical protein